MNEHRTLAEAWREIIMRELWQTKSVSAAFATRRDFLRKLLRNSQGSCTPDTLRGMASRLREVFQFEAKGDRSQSGTSKGGAVWEGLVLWYLNLGLLGTHAVAVKKKSLIPSGAVDALTVEQGNKRIASEPDVLVISSPEFAKRTSTTKKRGILRELEEVAATHYGSLGLINIQCKTSWADNVQVPMLWNMLYTQAYKRAVITNGFVVGVNGRLVADLGFFAYAFATVPTQKDLEKKFKPTSVTVLRVTEISGGNYWGLPSKDGVASSLDCIFNRFGKSQQVMPSPREAFVAASQGMGSAEVEHLFRVS